MAKMEYFGVGQEHHIQDVKPDGRRLELDDLSRWEIQPGHSTQVVCWYPTQRVLVEESNAKGHYPITNLETNQTVLGRFIPRKPRLSRLVKKSSRGVKPRQSR